MKFIALLLAFGLERLLSASLHLRQAGWLGGYARLACASTARAGALAFLAAVFFAVLPAAVVAVVAQVFVHELFGILWIVYAGTVLFFSLGPRDLGLEVSDYVAASRGENPEEAARVAGEILGHDASQRFGPGLESVGDAVFVQANNRLFGVVFWFVIAGPAGAALFRVTDVLRREETRCNPDAVPGAISSANATLQSLHGIIAWLPARLLAFTYGLAGSFDEAFSGWRRYLEEERDHFFEANDKLLVHAGRGALWPRYGDAADEASRAELAAALVRRAAYVWLTVLALLTVLERLP
jgi:AmpE protein